MQKDHYKTLGVIDTAEEAVIKAAYKALMQIYHPDRYIVDDDKARATKKTQELNKAYGILSNPKLRKEYDQQRASKKNQYEPEADNVDEEKKKNDVLDENWEIARQFVESLDELYKNLLLLSAELGFTFKLKLLTNKNFDQAKVIAKELENEYLAKYFGPNQDLQLFSKWLLQNKRRDIALEVNKVVNVLGGNYSVKDIIDKFVEKHSLVYTGKKEKFDYYADVKDDASDVSAAINIIGLIFITIIILIFLVVAKI